MKECKLSIINTAIGKRYLIVTGCKSKEFKTENGARRWAKNNGYKVNNIF
jgi:hypothetical protein